MRILTFLFCWALAAATTLSFALKDTSGSSHTEAELQSAKATVFVFVATDCPMSNSYAPELARIYDEYSARGVAFYAVHSDPSVSPAAVKKHAEEYRRPFPTLLDPNRRLARQTGATTTPEVAVVSPAGQVLYRGRVDDRYYDYGKARTNVGRHDLRAALDEILAGKSVSVVVTKTLGCAIAGIQP